MPTVEQLGLKVGDLVKWKHYEAIYEGELVGIDKDAVYIDPPIPGDPSIRGQDINTGQIGIFDWTRKDVRVLQAVNKAYSGFIPQTRFQALRSIIPASIDKVWFAIDDFARNILWEIKSLR